MLFYVATFMIQAGMGMLADRMFDTRRTITIGATLIIGLSFDIIPSLYQHLPAWLSQLVPSSLALAILVGLALNFLFGIGQRRSAELQWLPASGLGPVIEFVRSNAGIWGARTGLISRTLLVVEEFCSIGDRLAAVGTPINIRIDYDETSLALRCNWLGTPIQPLGQITLDADPNSASIAIGLAARFITHHTDTMSCTTTPSGIQRIETTISDA
jgi:xanthine permease XanP